jgi:hypothetical protein
MILASGLRLPFKPSKTTLELAQGYDIATSDSGLPFGQVWLGCRKANPHKDDGMGWDGMYFLCLSYMGDHEVGDAKSEDPRMTVQPGDLFAVDPKVTHWLVDPGEWDGKEPRPWLSLQWEVPRERAGAKARQLVAELGGTWKRKIDKRYAHWAKEQA